MPVNWHCMDLERPDGSAGDFCFSLATICEERRQRSIDKKYGKPGPCTTQAVAYCMRTLDTIAMGAQILCTRTAESCALHRKTLLAIDPPVVLRISACAPMYNVDPADPSRDPAPPTSTPAPPR